MDGSHGFDPSSRRERRSGFSSWPRDADSVDRISGQTLRMTVGYAARTLRANRLDIVAVGIDQERGEVGRAVVGAWPGATVIAASGLHALAGKFLDRRVTGRPERVVGASRGRARI